MGMMTTLRNRMHAVLWTLLALFLLSMTVGGLVGGANIIDQLLGRVNPAEAIGSVNGSKISPNQFNQAVNVRMDAIRSAGTNLSDQDLDRVREEVWNSFIEERLTEQAIEDLEIKVSDDEILFHLENNPPMDVKRLFMANNSFDEETYRQALNTPGMMDWTPIETWMREFYLPRFKLQQYINLSAVVSNQDVREEFIKRNTDFTISSLHIIPTALVDKIKDPSENELRADYNSRLDDFKREEKRHLSYVSWAKVPTQEDSLRVKEEALDIILAYSEGQNFANLANIHTMDPGNQVTPDSGKGGDLGWFGKGQMVPAFEEAVFNAKANSVVGPILTQFGYHVIKIDSIRNKGKNNHQVKAAHILLNIEMGQNTRTTIRRKATLFSYDAQDYGFLAALDTHSVTAQQANFIGENDMFIASLGVFRGGIRWAFNNDTDIGSISDPLETDNFYAVFTLDSISSEGIAPFEDARSQVFASLTRDKEEEATRALAIELKSQIDDGGSFESLKEKNEKLEYIPSDVKKLKGSFISLGRSDQVTGALINASAGDLLGPLKTNRGHSLIRVLEVSAFDSTAWQAQKDIVRADLTRQKQARAFQNWMLELKDAADIVDNRKYHF